jgi:CubicO group peptidase (beta-lactamase class C family)
MHLRVDDVHVGASYRIPYTLMQSSTASNASASLASAQVKQVLDSLIAEGPEIGLQVAAYLDGKLVVDAWSGVADRSSGKPVDGDSLFMLSSTTKGVTATCVAVLADRGKLDYDRPVASYWPEFAAHGKDRVTVREVIAQRSGIPQTPVGYTPEWLSDWDRMVGGIADLVPMFPPGERTSYASLTYGHMIGEVIRRIDGRSIGQFLQDEIARPLGGIDVYLGVPSEALERVAVLVDGPAAPPDYDARMVGEPAGSHVAEWFNRPEIQQAAIPGSGGIMSARGLARMYAMLANGGELDGARILSRASIARAAELQSYELDEIYRVRIRRGLGYRVGPDSGPGAGPNAFGHVGGGGSFGYADPDRNFAIAFAKNFFAYNSGTPPTRRAGPVVAAAVLSALQLE